MNLRPQTWALAAMLWLFMPRVAQAEDLPQTIADRLYRSYMQSKVEIEVNCAGPLDCPQAYP